MPFTLEKQSLRENDPQQSGLSLRAHLFLWKLTKSSYNKVLTASSFNGPIQGKKTVRGLVKKQGERERLAGFVSEALFV